MPGKDLRLLSLDGGGVRGLSSLFILRELMFAVNRDNPPKPCEYFHMIGGTSTGGLIAIMLGRLRMTIDECLDAYLELFGHVFVSKHSRLTWRGNYQGKFDTQALEQGIKNIILRKLGQQRENELLQEGNGTNVRCKIFVCATSKQTTQPFLFRNYRASDSSSSDLLRTTKIWEAARATSAAPTIFDSIQIGAYGEEFMDGGLNLNNPVRRIWEEAQSTFLGPGMSLNANLQCLISIGTGIPSLESFGKHIIDVGKALIRMVSETEETAESFHREHPDLDQHSQYFRFSVVRGLQGIGLDETAKKDTIASATRLYLNTQSVRRDMMLFKTAAEKQRHMYTPPKYIYGLNLGEAPAIDQSLFVGRELELESMMTHLSYNDEAPQRKTLILHGPGGIGKTQLAVNFAKRFQQTFSSIFWLSATEEVALRRSIGFIASRVFKSRRQNAHDMNGAAEEVGEVEQVREWLSNAGNNRWLLILDGFDDTDSFDLRPYLPHAFHGNVIITTRSRRLTFGTPFPVQKIDDVQQSLMILARRSDRPDLEKDPNSRALATRLDGLPLALATAGAYLRESADSCSEYLQTYETSSSELHEDAMKLLDYPGRSLYTTWAVSIKLLEAQSPDAARLLPLLAYFDNGCIWHELLKAGITQDSSGELDELIRSRDRFKRAMNKLIAYSFVEAVPGSPGSRYRLHNCVHDWTLNSLNSHSCPPLFAIAYLGVTQSVAHDDKAWDYALNKPLLQHAIRLDHPRFQHLICRAERGSLKFSHALGCLFKTQNQILRAQRVFERLLVIQKAQLGLTNIATLQMAADLAEVYILQGRLDEGLALCNRILRCKKSSPSREHEALRYATLGQIAFTYDKKGQRALAETYYRKSLSGEEGLGGTNNLQCLLLREEFGRFLLWKGALDEAAAMLGPALAALQNRLGPNSTPVLKVIDLLAYIHAQRGNLVHAEHLMHTAVRERINRYGASHGSTLRAMNNLGSVYRMQKRLPEALQIYQRALAAQSEVTGEDLISCLIIKSLAKIYLDIGRWREAEQLWQQALAICIKLETPTEVDKYEIMMNLVVVNRRMNYKQKADDILSRIPREHRDRLSNNGRPVAQNAFVFFTQLAVSAVTGGGFGLVVATGLHSLLDARRVNAQSR